MTEQEWVESKTAVSPANLVGWKFLSFQWTMILKGVRFINGTFPSHIWSGPKDEDWKYKALAIRKGID